MCADPAGGRRPGGVGRGEVADAVVVGAGPNGLVAAIALARAGWDVVVVEANETVGGAVRSAIPWPGVTVDLFSAFYPLAAASPVLSALELERFGLSWSSAPSVVAHCARPGDDDCPVIHPDPERTAAEFEREAAGDGQAWLDLCAQWRRIREPLLNALFTPFPPVLSGARLVHRLGTADALRVTRMASLPVTRLGTELFTGEGPRLLLAGNAMHADVPMDAAGSGLFGWLLCMLAQDVGFPVPRGGAGRLSQALAACAISAGARIDTGETVTSVVVGGGRALGIRTDAGRAIRARRAVLADVDAPRLFRDLVGARNLPPRLCQDLHHFQWDPPTVKLNWLVEGGIPWSADPAHRAGTVHLGTDLRGLGRWSADLAADRHPDQVFALVGQMTTADPSRSPDGTESAWAYTHLPREGIGRAEVDRAVRRLEATVEAFAPGFSTRVRERMVQRPDDLQDQDANLFHGAVNAGTAQLHQQLVFRPTLGRPETPVGGLYLAGASAHPGGGVHGACGWIAAQVALRANGALGPLHRVVGRGVRHLAYGRSGA
jgi:phytoene dehydrogenase-like protein